MLEAVSCGVFSLEAFGFGEPSGRFGYTAIVGDGCHCVIGGIVLGHFHIDVQLW